MVQSLEKMGVGLALCRDGKSKVRTCTSFLGVVEGGIAGVGWTGTTSMVAVIVHYTAAAISATTRTPEQTQEKVHTEINNGRRLDLLHTLPKSLDSRLEKKKKR